MSEDSNNFDLGPIPVRQGTSLGLKLTIIGAFTLSIISFITAGSVMQKVNAKKQVMVIDSSIQENLEAQMLNLELANDQYQTELERMRDQLKAYATERIEWKTRIDEGRIEVTDLHQKIKALEESLAAAPQPVFEGTFIAGAPVAGADLAAVQEPVVEAVEEVVVFEEDVVVEEEVVEEAPVRTEEPKVMTINRKFNFVVVNLGIRDQVKMGDKLSVVRKGKKIGNLQIEKLYDNFAAATIIDEDAQKSQIQPGDFIRKI